MPYAKSKFFYYNFLIFLCLYARLPFMTRDELREHYKKHPIKVKYWAANYGAPIGTPPYFRGPFNTEEEAREAHKIPYDPEKDKLDIE